MIMSSKVKVIKRAKSDDIVEVVAREKVKNEQQRNREIVEVIKSWIDDFKLQSISKRESALAFLIK
jgi:hypothetical protein